jgi:uncharacterized protein YecT (DUF1311 family)
MREYRTPGSVQGALGNWWPYCDCAHGELMKYIVLLILFFPLIAFGEEDLDCEKAWTTPAVNQCMDKDLVEAEGVMDKYLTKSLERYAGDNVSIVSIKKGQEAWLKYRDAQCDAVYDTWRDGTIRTSMELGCKLKLTHQRTTVLWQSFLTYVDSTPSLLPEPKPYKPKSH